MQGMKDGRHAGHADGGYQGHAGYEGMENMPGMEMGSKKEMTGAETRQMNGLTLSLTTAPEHPKAGDVLLKLTLTDQAGKPVSNARVVFVYTMAMPGMTDTKVMARHTKDGLYEGTVLFGMGGTWVVTVNMTVPGRPPIAEKFQFSVAGEACNPSCSRDSLKEVPAIRFWSSSWSCCWQPGACGRDFRSRWMRFRTCPMFR